MSDKPRILFLCTGNACRSQMAEGLCRQIHGDRITAVSAGIDKHGMNPHVVTVMNEIGIDINTQFSKRLDELDDPHFDLVVTVCGHAHETCPIFPGDARVVHQGFDDPPKLAQTAGSVEEALQHYRRVRDEIRDYVNLLPEIL